MSWFVWTLRTCDIGNTWTPGQQFWRPRRTLRFQHKGTTVKKDHLRLIFCLRPYHVESTSSRLITEVKQHWALWVLGWVTTWEHRVLKTFLLIFCLYLRQFVALWCSPEEILNPFCTISAFFLLKFFCLNQLSIALLKSFNSINSYVAVEWMQYMDNVVEKTIKSQLNLIGNYGKFLFYFNLSLALLSPLQVFFGTENRENKQWW